MGVTGCSYDVTWSFWWCWTACPDFDDFHIRIHDTDVGWTLILNDRNLQASDIPWLESVALIAA